MSIIFDHYRDSARMDGDHHFFKEQYLKIQKLTGTLTYLCYAINEYDQTFLLGCFKNCEELKKFWDSQLLQKHEADEKIRKSKLKENALAKLTSEEREALGIKP